MGANELKRLMVRLSSFFIVQQTHVALGLAHQHWFMLTLANSPVATTWLSNFHMRASPMSPTFTVNLIPQPGSSNTGNGACMGEDIETIVTLSILNQFSPSFFC